MVMTSKFNRIPSHAQSMRLGHALNDIIQATRKMRRTISSILGV